MTSDYKIPEDIKNRIPDYFYVAMAGELVSVFGVWVLQFHEDLGYYDLDSSTGGWVEAFRATCRKLDMQWLIEYYATLDWFDGDLFDSEIEGEIIDRFCRKENQGEVANCYYRYLCEKSKSE